MSTVSPVLVGRSDELDRMTSALEAAPGVLLIGGEAGVGKTRLVREFTERAQLDGAQVLIGGCLELGADGLPYAPFTAVLRGLVRELGIDGVTSLLPAAAATSLARLLPEFGEAGSSDSEARGRLFEVVLTLLERLATAGERHRVALIIEDAHWADRSTRDLLSFLVRNLSDGLLIVVTYRTDELHRGHPLRPLLAELARVEDVQRLELRRLTRAEATELARGVTGTQPPPSLMDRVYARSEGNPLFVEALMCCDAPAELPESLRDLLLVAVQRLPDETQELLRIASAGGTHIDHGLLAAVTGLGEADLTRTLRPAVAGNVLSVDGDGYAFRHALIREALHDDLLPGEHTRLHTSYAEALEATPSLLPRGRAVVELAHHWHAAHNTTWALISAWQAASATFEAAAYAEALNMLSRVLQLWDQVPEAAAQIDAEHDVVLEQAVVTADLAGDSERGIKFATAALRSLGIESAETAQSSGPAGAGASPRPGVENGQSQVPADAGAVALRGVRLLELRGRMLGRLGRSSALDDMRAAVRLVPSTATAHRARVLSTLATELMCSGRIDEAREIATEALTLARLVDEPPIELAAAMTLLCLDSGKPGSAARLAGLDQTEKLALRSAGYQPMLRVAVNRSHLLHGMGRYETAAQVARQGVRNAEDQGVGRIHGTFLAINLAEPLIALGQWDEALRVLTRALEQDPPPGYRAALLELTGEIVLARGDLARARSAFESASALLPAHGTRGPQDLFAVLRLGVAVRLADSDPATALRLLEPVLDRPGLPDDARYGWPVLVLGVDASVAAGDVAALRRIVDRARGLSCHEPPEEAHRRTFIAALTEAATTFDRTLADDLGSLGDCSPPGMATADAERTGSPEAERRLADADGAIPGELGSSATGADSLPVGAPAGEDAVSGVAAAWDAAADAWERLQQPYERARALTRAAQCRLGAGERDGALLRLATAAPLARALDVSPLVAHIDDLTRRARSTGSTALGLTPREAEVLRLLAGGSTNRDIAEALFISAKTASVHVSNILAKLGAANRGEAAAIAHRSGFLSAI